MATKRATESETEFEYRKAKAVLRKAKKDHGASASIFKAQGMVDYWLIKVVRERERNLDEKREARDAG